MNKQMLIYSPYAAKAIAEGRKRGMRFRAVNQREAPPEPFYEDGWWYEILESEYTIPSQGRERIKVLREAGIQIEELIIAHEAPKLLTAPVAQKEPIKPSTDTCASFDAAPLIGAIVGVLGAILTVIGVMVVAAVRIDPALIAVLPDGTWLEVATWYD